MSYLNIYLFVEEVSEISDFWLDETAWVEGVDKSLSNSRREELLLLLEEEGIKFSSNTLLEESKGSKGASLNIKYNFLESS
jgi:hypothetical protein